MSRFPRFLLRATLVLLLLLLTGAFAGWWALRGSLARLDGELTLPGLSAPLTLERDALGSATIRAANELDAVRALGYVHAQERFFEMDLLRRSAAGELSELFGPIAIEKDKSIRVHRMRSRVRDHLESLAGKQMPLLAAYTEGVNDGLRDLRTRPWPYLLLRTQPEPWAMEDTGLAGYAMYFDLQDESNSRELALWRIRQAVPAALYRLIAADGTEWDAPLLGAARGNVALPAATELDLRKLPMPASELGHGESEPAAPGSNNFAVDGRLTGDGRAILANDMHLGLRVPNIWFRARMIYDDARAPGGKVDVAGFTLPGTPLVVVGSNRHVAWGFTNSYGDWADWFRVSDDPAAPTHTFDELIHVKGGADVSLSVEEDAWGPVIAREADGRRLSLFWVAHVPGSLTLGLADFARAGSVDEALTLADAVGIPQQNLVLADSRGDIAWKLVGRIPVRGATCDPGAVFDTPARPLPPPPRAAMAASAAAACYWPARAAALGESHQRSMFTTGPSLVRPASHRLWTANARTTDGATLAMIGDAGYANGARARQIRDQLFAKPRFGEADLLEIQLDDRALFLERWWRLLRERAASGKDPAWKQLAAATAHWEGRAAPDAVSYRLVRAWRLAMIDRIRHGLMAPAMTALGKDFVMPDLPQIEGVAWQLAAQRPAHLLPRRFASWEALELEAAREVVAQAGEAGPLGERTWGEQNTARICHPMASALPSMARSLLCMPADALAGDANMPRVVAPAFGASERMVVAPGHEEDGIVHMPGGASGHPLSPFWGAGHEDWVRGAATPFLPGPATHQLRASP
jgi:penicillin amidase